MPEYRVITKHAEMEQCTDLEMLVWGMGERPALSAHTMQVLLHTGGNIMGAFEGERLIGCTIAFASHDGRLWSHIAAVHPEYQRQGIGYQLKHHQREWALGHGYKIMSWTFDPLMRQNAHFNLHLLGARTNSYRVNFYGNMDDSINLGLPSDRLESFWFLDQAKAELNPPPDAPFLLRVGDQHVPQLRAAPESDWYRVEIPWNWYQLKQQNRALALSWLETLRETLIPAFRQGYWMVDFFNEQESGRCWYLLRREL